MADENNNLDIVVDGSEQATIGTDVYSSGGETAHAQVMKVAWGDSSTVTRATENSPLPVKVFGLTGPLGTVTVTGAVRGLGTFNVGNTSGSAIHVTGGVNAFVYGVTGATPVAVTGSVSILSSVGITGVVNVTGGRYLNSATDSIMVSGTLAKSWNLTNANDNITVYGVGGATFLSSKIMGSDGTIIGNSGGALNVNLVGAGISATVNVETVVSVRNATGDVLRIEGTAGGTPVPVSISAITPSINVVNGELNPFFMDLMKSLIAYNVPGQSGAFLNNLEKILLANEPGSTTKFIPIAEILRSVASISGAFGGPNSIYERLRKIEDGTSSIKTSNLTDATIKTKRVSLNSTNSVVLDSTAAISNSIKHGVTIKNTGSTIVTIGAGIPTGLGFTAPTDINDFGIVLNVQESIFIPAKINIPGVIFPPLYGRVDFSDLTGITGTVAIMAV